MVDSGGRWGRAPPPRFKKRRSDDDALEKSRDDHLLWIRDCGQTWFSLVPKMWDAGEG